jgi:hypothetical protein
LWLWQGLANTTGSANDSLLENLAIGLEVAAAIVGFLVSWRLYRPPGRVDPDARAPAEPSTERPPARAWRQP